MTKKNQTGLGKGLSALLENASQNQDIKRNISPSSSPLVAIQEIELKNIVPNPFQPRKEFDKEKLEELAQSIKLIGVIQPITVTKLSVGRYQLISGERRFRASTLAGLTTIPAYIKKEVDDTSKLEMAIVENIQREDLDPIDIALSFNRLIEECSLTQEQLSSRVGKNRASISNYLRLLKLPTEVQFAIKAGKISMGHAKALMGLNSDNLIKKFASKIIEEGLSVRQIEEIVKKNNNPLDKKNREKNTPSQNSIELGNILKKYFSNKVAIKSKDNGSGQLIINYQNEQQINNFLKLLKEHNL